MSKRLLIIILVAIAILVTVVALYANYLNRTANTGNHNTAVTYTTVTDNELVILHLNANVAASKIGVQLELTQHTKQDDGVDTAVTVRDSAGTELGTLRFSAVDETQTIGSYRFRLVSATNSAVQVLVLATVAE